MAAMSCDICTSMFHSQGHHILYSKCAFLFKNLVWHEWTSITSNLASRILSIQARKLRKTVSVCGCEETYQKKRNQWLSSKGYVKWGLGYSNWQPWHSCLWYILLFLFKLQEINILLFLLSNCHLDFLIPPPSLFSW